jgi:hypothetical protein
VTVRQRPCTVKAGVAFVRQVHRRLPRVEGAMWAISALDDAGNVVGVILVGRPNRGMQGPVNALTVLNVSRLAAVEGNRNVCSLLYGAAARAARDMGADDLVTYTHEDEHGASLKASGWVDGGLTDGGEWDCPTRPRKRAADARPKRRWFAPWGIRAKEILARRREAATA